MPTGLAMALGQLDDADKYIDKLKQQNAALVEALKVTQDSARMAALAVDVRLTLNPSKAVDYFNSMFPEVERAISKVEGDK